MEKIMKRKLLQVLHSLRSRCGNTIAEFTVTTAMMATLAATAAPKLSEGPKTNSMMSIKESADLHKEVQQLSRQRDHLKEEIVEMLIAQNEMLMKNVANSHLRNSTLDYSAVLSDITSEDLYDSEPNDYQEGPTGDQYYFPDK